MEEIVYKYSQLKERVDYNKTLNNFLVIGHKEIKKRKNNTIHFNYHLGQFKLLITETLFLSKYAKDGNKVVYVGAAEGYHTSYLADMFPNLTFDLWDPRKFDIQETDRIKIFNRNFEDSDAHNYAKDGKNILFISDIRSLSFGDVEKIPEKLEEGDNIVDNDMIMQKNWVRIIKPIYASLKVRFGYLGKISSYLTGDIYLQAYAPLSTENRLFTNNYTDEILYDNSEYDEKMAYFNFKIRMDIDKKYDRFSSILDKYNIQNNWDNNIAMYTLNYYLEKYKNIKDYERVGVLFMDIVNYHKKKYKYKYDVIFNS